jgi:hypothetical protein
LDRTLLKFSIRTNVAYDEIAHHVAPGLRRNLPPAPSAPGQAYTLVIFHGGEVVHGRVAAKAARRVRAQAGVWPQPVLVLAYDLTTEAYAELRPFGATFVTQGNWLWTDTSHEEDRHERKAGD